MKNKAIFKFNSGNPVLLCSQCGAIIKNSRSFSENEQKACSGKIYLEPQYCNGCKTCKELEKRKKERDKLIPIEWRACDELDCMVHAFSDVEFLEDFGVFSKGEIYPDVAVDYEVGKIEAWDKDDNLVKKQRFKIVPVND